MRRPSHVMTIFLGVVSSLIAAPLLPAFESMPAFLEVIRDKNGRVGMLLALVQVGVIALHGGYLLRYATLGREEQLQIHRDYRLFHEESAQQKQSTNSDGPVSAPLSSTPPGKLGEGVTGGAFVLWTLYEYSYVPTVLDWFKGWFN